MPDFDRDNLHATLEAMNLYGGSFARAIAQAAARADAHNLERLLHAFPDLFEEYQAIANRRSHEV